MAAKNWMNGVSRAVSLVVVMRAQKLRSFWTMKRRISKSSRLKERMMRIPEIAPSKSDVMSSWTKELRLPAMAVCKAVTSLVRLLMILPVLCLSKYDRDRVCK